MFNTRAKNCPQCGASFHCGPDHLSGRCWCDRYPPILAPTPGLDCLCPKCLTLSLKPKISAYIAAIPREERRGSPAVKFAEQGVCIEGIDYYKENGYTVFTEWYHLKRGECCGNGCRHCPYEKK